MIQKVIINNITGLLAEPDSRLISIFDKENQDKAQEFFLQIGHSDNLSECELVVESPENLLVLYFKGILVGEDRLVMAESDFDELLQYYTEMMSLNNNLVNTIRNIYKSSRSSDMGSIMQIDYLQELTKVNNELVSVQRELNKTNTELTKLNNIKNQFVGMAAHDLRNPLGIIQSYSGFILDELKNSISPTHEEFLQIIHSTSIYMLKLVEGILDLTYIQSG
ncbi:MAG: histidine kinase dimerization/phospho-acceptor domain-containing protein, partial [Candidatus Cloacimonadaceae bacterium]|nr:histidine kinase dimerization/phospho-acceptor domain-containing protein [Candidatus Cloacimonadaceae bacterium]